MRAQDISNDLWIIGVIAAAALVLSTVMALIYFFFSLCGGAGAHICCAAVPLGCAAPLPCLGAPLAGQSGALRMPLCETSAEDACVAAGGLLSNDMTWVGKLDFSSQRGNPEVKAGMTS